MSERYTFDVPAYPDPEFVSADPDFATKKSFEEALLDRPDLISDELKRSIMQSMNRGQGESQKVPSDYPRRYFEWSGAQEYIHEFARYDTKGQLDIDRTTRAIGVPYTYNMTGRFNGAEIVGLPGSPVEQPVEIHLRKDDTENHRVSIGHEIGHYFYRAVMGNSTPGYDQDEEDFCEYFGRAMAMPGSAVFEHIEQVQYIDETTLLSIMSRFKVTLRDAILQLMEYRLLPPRIAIDSYNGKSKNPDFNQKVTRGFFCKHCDETGGDYNCPNAGTNSPLYDFTDRAWGGKVGLCLGEDLHEPAILSALTKYYMELETQLVLFRPSA